MSKGRALRASAWSGIDLVGRQGIQFLATIVLARMLAPSDFGLIAMVSLLIGLSSLLADGGLSLALIQKQTTDQAEESSVFWFNLCVALLLWGLIAVAAPAIATFFEEPLLARVTPWLALSPLLSSLSNVHLALLSRRLNFRSQAAIGIVASSVSAAGAIALAAAGYGIWALVAQPLLLSAVTAAVIWRVSHWRPLWLLHPVRVRHLMAFGGYSLAANVSEMLFSRLHTLVIGRLFGATPLAFYAQADYLRLMPTNLLGSMTARVALPMLSRAQDDPASIRRGVQLAVRTMTLINAPTMLLLGALADPIVTVLLGPQWSIAAAFLRVLALAGVLYPLHFLNIHALLALGHARLVFQLELVKKPLGIVLLLSGACFGLEGIAWSQVISSLAAVGINAHYSRRSFQYGAHEQLRDALPPILVAATIGILAHLAAESLALSPWMTLAMLGPISVLGYIVVIAMLRAHAWEEAVLLWQARHSGERCQAK